MADESGALEAFRRFAAQVQKKTAAKAARGEPEDQLRAPLEELLTDLGSLLGREVIPKGQSAQAHIGKPDYAVIADDLLVGHAECKAPGKGANPNKFKGHDKEQWARFRDLPNVLYTDGSEWSLCRGGVILSRMRFKGDIVVDGKAAITGRNATALLDLFRDFFGWNPIVPSSPKELAAVLAPLCHLLRKDVLDAVQDPTADLSLLANDWREYLFPDADNAQFADAYAQTLTYALLLARFSGLADVAVDKAQKAIKVGHSLLADALRILADPQVRDIIDAPLSLLERSISAIDVAALHGYGSDPWLYFYEDFLAEYDPRLRKDRGVYYTPAQVVKAQIALVAELLETKFGKALTYADDEVVFLDPGVGTGTYALQAIDDGLRRVEARFGAGAVPGYATQLAKQVHGFEILVGPYAVAHLRISQRILEAEGELPSDGAHIYLTDTLESPYAAAPGTLPLTLKPLATEHKRAQKIKADTRVIVCMGNPPYDRQVIEPEDMSVRRKGGWVRFGDDGKGGILEDFLRPARDVGAGIHIKNLYNDYVYFWRWALWKVFDSTSGPGIFSFISASSYVRGPGFVGLRRYLREVFDECWIIDLEGSTSGPRKTENIFEIQTPVAIAVGVRYGAPSPTTPAVARYAKIVGTREEKLAHLNDLDSFAGLAWKECLSEWQAPLLPVTEGDYFSWPSLTDLFPWQHTGVQMKRTWPIATDEDTLRERWEQFVSSADKKSLFRETRDRKVGREYPRLHGAGSDGPLGGLTAGAAFPPVESYAYRVLDRQRVLVDNRLGDFMKPVLWSAHGPKQVYMTSLLTQVIGEGPAVFACADVPDIHHFRGSYGAKDIVPLWRDAHATQPNLTPNLTRVLGMILAVDITPEDLFAYCYALLAGREYGARFSEELEIPGPRVPITRDPVLWSRGVVLGRELLALHTFGKRFKLKKPLGGKARCVRAVPGSPTKYPTQYSYNAQVGVLRVGDGEFVPVSPEVYGYSVSGHRVIASWLDYRMAAPRGRKSSDLDDIGTHRWRREYTQELLEALWVLEQTVALEPQLRALLISVVEGPSVTADELPTPSATDRAPPTVDAGRRTSHPEQQALDWEWPAAKAAESPPDYQSGLSSSGRAGRRSKRT